MPITRCVGFFGKMATLWVAMSVVVLCMSLGALVLFNAALLIWLDQHVGLAASVALVGLALLLEAGGVFFGFQLVLKRMKARQPNGVGSLLGVAGVGLRFATLAFQRSPRKALLAAVIFGALADYFTSSRAPKD